MAYAMIAVHLEDAPDNGGLGLVYDEFPIYEAVPVWDLAAVPTAFPEIFSIPILTRSARFPFPIARLLPPA
jgi:hypothetical protein